MATLALPDEPDKRDAAPLKGATAGDVRPVAALSGVAAAPMDSSGMAGPLTGTIPGVRRGDGPIRGDENGTPAI